MIIKGLYTIAFLFLLQEQIFAQEVAIQGKVMNKKKEPVAGANVFFKVDYSGSATDSNGLFHFNTTHKGKHTLVISALSYATKEIVLELADSPVDLDIVLSFDYSSLGEVVITAGSFIVGEKQQGATLNSMDVMTTPGHDGDLANAFRTLPGAQQIGEQEGLFIRGGNNNETKQFIDGTCMPTPNFTAIPGIAQPARFSPFLFKGITFSSGGYSAQYGQAMSGALILESVDLPVQTSAKLGISPMMINGGYQRLSDKKNTSFGFNFRYLNYRLYNGVVPQNVDFTYDPEFLAADANFRIRTKRGGIVKLFVSADRSRTGLNMPMDGSLNPSTTLDIRGKNLYTNISYKEYLKHNWILQVAGSFTDNIQQYSMANPYFVQRDGNYEFALSSGQGKVVLQKHAGNNISFMFGAETFLNKEQYRSLTQDVRFNNFLYAAFAETDITVNNRLALKAGLRTEYSALFGRTNLAPRLNMAWRFADNGQINFSAGRFFQNSDFRMLQPVNNYSIYISGQFQDFKQLDFESASHFILNYSRISRYRTFRIEAYYKSYNNLVKTWPELTNNGKGYAGGIEFFWRDKKTIPNLDYWVSWSYLHTQRDYLNAPYAIKPTFATPHTVSIVAKRQIEKIRSGINVSYTFATGRPYYYITEGRPEITDAGTTEAYHMLNLSLSHIVSLFPKWKHKDFSVIAIGVNNLTGSSPVFGYSYSDNGNIKTPVGLPAPRRYFLAIFMSFGIDRTNEILDNEL